MLVQLLSYFPDTEVAAEKSLEEEIAAEIEAEAEEDDGVLTAVDEEEDHGHLLTAMPSPAALVDVAYVMPGRQDDDGAFYPRPGLLFQFTLFVCRDTRACCAMRGDVLLGHGLTGRVLSVICLIASCHHLLHLFFALFSSSDLSVAVVSRVPGEDHPDLCWPVEP